MSIGMRLRAGAQSPVALAHLALMAEQAGLDFVKVADDLRLIDRSIVHPSSPWPAIGAIAVATRSIDVRVDGLTPFGVIHPAGAAHLAATAVALLPGRFGIGFSAGTKRTITGRTLPNRSVRERTLHDTIDAVRSLLARDEGDKQDQRDRRIVIRDLVLPGKPSAPMPISITATTVDEAELAASLECDLVVGPGGDPASLVIAYRAAGGAGTVSAPVLVDSAPGLDSAQTNGAVWIDRAVNDDDHSAASLGPPTHPSGLAHTIAVATLDDEALEAAIDSLRAAGVDEIELIPMADRPHDAVEAFVGLRWRDEALSEHTTESAPTVDDARSGIKTIDDDKVDATDVGHGDRPDAALQTTQVDAGDVGHGDRPDTAPETTEVDDAPVRGFDLDFGFGDPETVERRPARKIGFQPDVDLTRSASGLADDLVAALASFDDPDPAPAGGHRGRQSTDPDGRGESRVDSGASTSADPPVVEPTFSLFPTAAGFEHDHDAEPVLQAMVEPVDVPVVETEADWDWLGANESETEARPTEPVDRGVPSEWASSGGPADDVHPAVGVTSAWDEPARESVEDFGAVGDEQARPADVAGRPANDGGSPAANDSDHNAASAAPRPDQAASPAAGIRASRDERSTARRTRAEVTDAIRRVAKLPDVTTDRMRTTASEPVRSVDGPDEPVVDELTLALHKAMERARHEAVRGSVRERGTPES